MDNQEESNNAREGLVKLLGSGERLYGRGLQHLRNGEYTDAIMMLKGALVHDPDNEKAIDATKRAYISAVGELTEKGDLDLAGVLYEQALEFDPTLKDGMSGYDIGISDINQMIKYIENNPIEGDWADRVSYKKALQALREGEFHEADMYFGGILFCDKDNHKASEFARLASIAAVDALVCGGHFDKAKVYADVTVEQNPSMKMDFDVYDLG